MSAEQSTTEIANAPPTRRHPLGPVILTYTPVNRSRTRRHAVLVAIGCAALLILSAWLQPDALGMGTHTQLGLPQCSWPSDFNLPCPTCGMTTAFALLVRGRVGAAFHAQPLGALLAAVTMAVLMLALREIGARTVWRVNWYRVRPIWAVAGVLFLALASWGYKILAMRGGLS